MKKFSYIWRMARRRKWSCLLVVLVTMGMTVFMLFYPSVIKNTRKKLNDTYKRITVSGSIEKIGTGDQMAVSGNVWKEMQESGYFQQLYAGSRFYIRTFPKEVLEKEVGNNAFGQKKDIAFQKLLSQFETTNSEGVDGSMKSYNNFAAEDELIRIQDEIRWLEGYGEYSISGEERICIISENWGYDVGDTIPFLTRVWVNENLLEGIIHLKVVGTYPGKVTEFAGVMPLKTMENLTVDATAIQKQAGNYHEWAFGIDQVYFTVKNNQKLDKIKKQIREWKLFSNDFRRVRLDDRKLKEVVEPIKSNLVQLERSYFVFFFMITGIGFLIAFLLVRDRREEHAIMRMLGESRRQVVSEVLVEGSLRCIAGILAGISVIWIMNKRCVQPTACVAILLCYMLGAAGAVLLTVRGNVMEILHEKE